VQVVGTALHTVADDNGEFALGPLQAGDVLLLARHVGHVPLQEEWSVLKGGGNIWNPVLDAAPVSFDEVVVTANREEISARSLPGGATVLGRKQLRLRVHRTPDELIAGEPGVSVLREGGLFTMAPAVILRGTGADEPGRTLVLVDGVPVNKQDTGGANWNRLAWLLSERVEIVRGALSSVYGSGAMGGAVQLVTPAPRRGTSVQASMHGGSFGTYGGFASVIRGVDLGESRLLELTLRAGGRSSDGYTATLEQDRTQYTMKNFLREQSFSASVAYSAGPNQIQFSYDRYDDLRGEGEKIQAADGETRSFTTDAYRLTSKGGAGSLTWRGAFWAQLESYERVDERIRGDEYQRFDVLSDRTDGGAIAELTLQTSSFGRWTAGVEVRRGEVDGADTYRTSPDFVVNRGILDITALTLRNRYSRLAGSFQLFSSLRYDAVSLHDAEIVSTLSPWDDVAGPLDDETWQAVSPGLGASLRLGESVFHASASMGFRAPPLDDLTRSGFTRVGPKIANPSLEPERIVGVDGGLRTRIGPFGVDITGYASEGRDFLAYVDTGEPIFGGRFTLKQRQNVAKVQLYGIEYTMNARVTESIGVDLAATIRHSEIMEFPEDEDREGQKLEMSPEESGRVDLVYTGVVDFTATWEFVGDQFYFNSGQYVELAGYGIVHMRLARALTKGLELSVAVHNMFGRKHLGSVTMLAPGRFVMATLSYRLNNNSGT
jgi:iron complex outermembrane receptor protein